MTAFKILLQAGAIISPVTILFVVCIYMFIYLCIRGRKALIYPQHLTQPYNLSKRLRAAGIGIRGIFYCILSQLLLVFLYWFVIGLKVGYGAATNSFDISEFEQYNLAVSIIFLLIELIIAITFLTSLWKFSQNLKKCDL